jgi:hypothetical protein
VISVAFRPPPGSTIRPPAGLKEKMEAAAIAAAQELLAAYRVSIQPVEGARGQAPAPALAALGVVRFTAPELSGTATLGTSATLLRRSNPVATSDRDWIAELANQFFGRFKLKLLRGGFELWSMAPVAVTGRLLATGISQPASAPFAFVDARGGAVALWIDVEINGEIRIEPPAGDSEIPHEGDVLLF